MDLGALSGALHSHEASGKVAAVKAHGPHELGCAASGQAASSGELDDKALRNSKALDLPILLGGGNERVVERFLDEGLADGEGAIELDSGLIGFAGELWVK